MAAIVLTLLDFLTLIDGLFGSFIDFDVEICFRETFLDFFRVSLHH
jgi:hypothetical protein